MRAAQSGAFLTYFATAILVVVALYFGKPVLMPLALATLLAFLLSPLVDALCRKGLAQSIAVTLVVVLVFSVLGGMVWGFGRQMSSLINQLPDYRQNIREKIEDLRAAGNGSTVERIRQAWKEIKGDFRRPAPTNNITEEQITTIETNEPVELEPVPVVVQSQAASQIPTALGPLVQVLATAGLVVVLVIFMLLRRRELRNRLIVLFGYHRMPTTTRAIDEAVARISRYLLMQTTINSTYGIAVGTGLYFLGLPYALMWGFLAALLRFIPYVGPWLGALMPILLSLAVFPGWLHPFLVLGMILVFELFSNMLMEPLLYGQSVGVSEVALIFAVAFWTWIWGPIGLALATPLTVCLIVIGKHVPGLSFLPMLMSDEPVSQTPLLFYQRLLAMDDDEALEIASNYRASRDLIDAYDDLLLPTLMTARRDHLNHQLSTEHLDHIIGASGQIISKLAAERVPDAAETRPDEAHEVLGVPVEDTVDEMIMSMLANVLPRSILLKSVSADALSAEVLDQVEQRGVSVVCIGAAVPGGTHESRYLVKRLQSDFPRVAVIFGRWGLRNEKRLRDLSNSPGIQGVGVTLKDVRNLIVERVRIAESASAAASNPADNGPGEPAPLAVEFRNN